MTHYMEVSGLRATGAALTRPRYGAWVADVTLAGATLLPTAKFGAALRFGALQLTGTVHRQAAFGGAVRARIIGGAGGWRASLPEKGYSHKFGVLVSTVLKDAAEAVGERVSVGFDPVLGTHWARRPGRAAHTLRKLSAGQWYVDDAGTTQVRARAAARITSPFTATQRQGDRGRFEIATEALADWVPGRTFSSPIVPEAQEIDLVVLRVDEGDGAARVSVLTGPSERDRLLGDVREIIRQETFDASYAGVWKYTLVTGTSESASLLPKSQGRVPPLDDVPYMPSLLGEKVTPAPGSTCYVVFVDHDPAQPMIVAIAGAPLVYEQTAAISKIGDGLLPAARMFDLAGPFPVIATAVRTLI